MSHLVCNKASVQSAQHLYKQSNHLVRTPILYRVQPDQKKICQIGDPRTMQPTGDLAGGFHGGNTYSTTVESVGYEALNYMINGQPQWHDASSAHDPELVWYQGAYATSAATILNGKFMSEAYASFPGFHFTLPQVQSPLEIKNVKVYYLNMGATLAFGPAIDGNANNKNIKNSGMVDWTNAWVTFHVLNTPTCNYHPMYIINNTPCDNVDLATVGSQGDFKGYRDLFMLAPMGTTDGCIPTLTNPVRENYTMSSSTKSHFTQNGAGWIVPMFHPWVNSQDPTHDYRPRFIYNQSGTDNYWGCFSLRDVYIDVEYDVP